MQAAFWGQRIFVVGTSGSGKTTLARQVSQRLQIPHLELDALYWEPNWGNPPEDIFRQRVSDALMGERWIIDGNYSQVPDITWERLCQIFGQAASAPTPKFRLS